MAEMFPHAIDNRPIPAQGFVRGCTRPDARRHFVLFTLHTLFFTEASLSEPSAERLALPQPGSRTLPDVVANYEAVSYVRTPNKQTVIAQDRYECDEKCQRLERVKLTLPSRVSLTG
jgi:hypothetical protein